MKVRRCVNSVALTMMSMKITSIKLGKSGKIYNTMMKNYK